MYKHQKLIDSILRQLSDDPELKFAELDLDNTTMARLEKNELFIVLDLQLANENNVGIGPTSLQRIYDAAVKYNGESKSYDLIDLVKNKINPRYRKVVELRNGLIGEVQTFGQIAQELNVTRERARQIEIEAQKIIGRYLPYVNNDEHNTQKIVSIAENKVPLKSLKGEKIDDYNLEGFVRLLAKLYPDTFTIFKDESSEEILSLASVK